MSFFDAIRHRLRSALRPDAEQRDRDEEFAFHQSLDAPELARREFGDATYLSEEVRWMGATRWIDAIRQDARYGLRALKRSPVFALVAVLSIALGIGANTAVFGIIHTVMLSELPLPRPRELVLLHLEDAESGAYFNWDEYRAVARAPGAQVTAFSSTYSDSTEINGSSVSIGGVDLVPSNYHRVLGLTPAAGRFFTAEDETSGSPVAVITFDLATRFFNSPLDALGRTIRLHSLRFTVVGVAPKGYHGLKLL